VSEDEEEPHGIVKDAPNIPQNAMNIVPLNYVPSSITKHVSVVLFAYLV
jgi:hypothetical protein